jgi:hypothetical protein
MDDDFDAVLERARKRAKALRIERGQEKVNQDLAARLAAILERVDAKRDRTWEPG